MSQTNSIKEYQREYHLANRERLRELKRENLKRWRLKHPARASMFNRVHKQAYRARRAGAKVVTRINKKDISNWESRICGICGLLISDDFHLDHIIPISRGGKHLTSNLQLAHPYCNRSKSNKLPEELTPVLL